MNKAVVNKALAGVLLGLCVSLVACKPAEEPAGEGPNATASGGSGGRAPGSGGNAGNASGGNQANGGNQASGGVSGSGGTTTASGGSTGSGGSPAAAQGGAGGATASGGAGGGADAARADTPASSDAKPAGDGRPGILSEGADYPGRPEVRICPKDWTHEQCCEFLCRCLSEICTDAPKGQKGIPTCKTWCPKLSNMAMRCHVYHCFESVSMGGKKDHDSHCGHAADQVPGGMCRKDVYE